MEVTLKVYRCYSNPLKEFLMKNEQKYLLIAKDCVTDKTFWLFENNGDFQKLLDAWKANSPLRK